VTGKATAEDQVCAGGVPDNDQGGTMVRFVPVGRVMAGMVCVAAVAAVLFCLGGCGDEGADGGADQTGPASLDGTEWSLVRWRESSLDPVDFTITATFADGRISGTSAVNTYGGSYTTGPGNDFSVGELASTMMAGPEADMEAEAAYLRLLQDAASFHVTETTLTLFGSDGAESLIFTAAGAE
jgi:heat shock protein HslJ